MGMPVKTAGFSRRQALAVATGAVAGTLLPEAAAARQAAASSAPVAVKIPQPTIPALGELAAASGILFGASIGSDLPPDYAALYARQTRIVTTDLAMKFDYLRPNATDFNFDAADSILRFADAHRLKLRGHTLVWNENAPQWLKSLSAREIERVFDAHLETMATRYAGRLHSWDVVNEPFWPGHDKTGGYRDGPWFSAMGASYVPRAFRRVHGLDSGVKLCLNEAHCEIDNDWGRGIRPRLLRLVDDLLDSGAPLHAVGLQGHLQPQWGFDDDAFQKYIGEIGKRGVEIYITEMDVNDEGFPADPAARDARVAERYGAFLQHVLAVPQVKIVETWQLADKYSWYRDLDKVPSSRKHRPLPFDTGLQPKKAFEAMAHAFRQRTA